MSNVNFIERPAYPVIFMMIVCLVFVGVLAVFFRNSEAKIKSHQLNSYNELIVDVNSSIVSSVTGISEDSLIKNSQETLDKYIRENSGYSRKCFDVVVNDSIVAYCFDIKGKGLWGSMAALISVSSDFNSINEFAVYEQMETPGLGSRIVEDFFKDQFKGKPIIQNERTITFTLVPERQENIVSNEIRQVTGATITSNSVLTMITNEIDMLYREYKQGKK